MEINVNLEYKSLLPPLTEAEYSGLKESLEKEGQHYPIIVSKNGTILDGHNRFEINNKLGRSTDFIVREFASENKEKIFVIESNLRRRHLRDSAKVLLGLKLEPLYAEEARAIMEAQTRDKGGKFERLGSTEPNGDESPDDRKTSAKVAKAVGLSRTQYERGRVVVEKIKEYPDLTKKYIDGEKSTSGAYKEVKKRDARKRLAENPPEESDELMLFKHLEYAPIPWDVWTYKRDKIYGLDWPGSIPAGIVFNTLYFYTEPGDLVVDPMAGGGVVGDVCKVTERECRMFDVVPGRDDIISHDLRDGFPVDDADLVFLDPPYYKKMEKDYGPDSISALDRTEYLEFFEYLATTIHDSGAKRVALLMSDYTDDDDPEGHIFIWHYVDIFEANGWIPVRHIMAPISTTAVHPDFVVKFRKSKKLARLGRSLVIFERKHTW